MEPSVTREDRVLEYQISLVLQELQKLNQNIEKLLPKEVGIDEPKRKTHSPRKRVDSNPE